MPQQTKNTLVALWTDTGEKGRRWREMECDGERGMECDGEREIWNMMERWKVGEERDA
jgi:hypothetical protein